MKKLIAMLLALIMVLGLVACGAEEAPAATEAPKADAPAATEAAGEDAPADVEPIVIGMSQPLTGTNALVGDSALKGAQIAIDQINAAGGVLGRPLTLINYDDQGNPEEGVKLATRLLEDDKVDWISSSLISSVILAQAPTFDDAGIILLGTGTSSTWMAPGYEHVFRPSPAAGSVYPAMAETAAELGIKTIAIFRGTDDSSASGAQDFTNAAEAVGIEIIGVETYNDGDTDFSGQAIKLANMGADAIFTSTYSVVQAQFAKQLRQSGYTGLVFNKEAVTVEHIKAAGPAHDYYIFSWPYVTYNSLDEINPETDPVMYKFCEDYMAKYNEMPYHDCAYRQYDSILALAAAAEAAGSIDSDAMAEALNTKVNNIQGLGGVIDFTSDANGPHEGLVEYTAWIILNEQFVRLDEWVQSDEFKAMQAEFGAN